MGRFSDFVSELFIQGVGITRPKPGYEHRAALFITTLLALTLTGAFGMFLFLLRRAF